MKAKTYFKKTGSKNDKPTKKKHIFNCNKENSTQIKFQLQQRKTVSTQKLILKRQEVKMTNPQKSNNVFQKVSK